MKRLLWVLLAVVVIVVVVVLLQGRGGQKGNETGTYDAAISSISIRPDRAASMNFSHPYFTAGQIITTLKSNTDITGNETFSGESIGVKSGITGDFLLRA